MRPFFLTNKNKMLKRQLSANIIIKKQRTTKKINIIAKKINNNLLMEILYLFNQIILDNMKIYDYKTIQIITK